MTLPSGRALTWNYDSANRISGVYGTPAGGAQQTYASSISYAPHGEITQMTIGNPASNPPLVETRQYSADRMQPKVVSLTAGANSLWSLGYYYCPSMAASCTTNNGNPQSATIAPLGVTQTYSYDTIGRLAAASEGSGWTQTYVYDPKGNRALLGGAGQYIPSQSGTPQVTAQDPAQVAAQFTNNRWSGGSYDNAGNQTGLAGTNWTYSFDAEGRMTKAVSATLGTSTYAYGGAGERVQRVTGGVTTTYVYSADGNLAAEYTTGAVANPCGTPTCYVAADGLGSTRAVVDSAGNVKKRYDYLPFGEELYAGVGGRTTATGYQSQEDALGEKFTGKERDAESGLDYFGFRYLSSAQGRWTSPDEPFADQHPEDPQSWNLYGYVRNNPLKNTDPNGKDCQNGVSACANYIAGGFGAVVNAFSSGLINAPNHIANALISLTGSSFRIGDAVQPAFTPANEEQQQGANAANAVMLVAPVAEAGAAALVEAVGTGTRVETGAAAATDVPTSIPAGPTARPTAAQQAAINEMGDAHGCNTCGTSNPGTQSGNWVGDHQPPTALNPPGGAQVYQPQCLQCSRQQGGQVAAAVKAAKKAACTTGSNGTTTCQ